MLHYFVVRGNLCMHTLPKLSPHPTPLSGDLSVLATFIQFKVINFRGCKLVTGRCGVGGKQLQMCGGGKGERGEWVTYRDVYLERKLKECSMLTDVHLYNTKITGMPSVTI